MFVRLCYRGLDGHCLGHLCILTYFINKKQCKFLLVYDDSHHDAAKASIEGERILFAHVNNVYVECTSGSVKLYNFFSYMAQNSMFILFLKKTVNLKL
jgi:hypothetical protein